MIVNLTTNGFYLDELKIENKKTQFFEIVKLLGSNYRKIELKYGITLLIFDNAGIRLWIENDKVNQVQVLLSKDEQGEKFPQNSYQGVVIIDDKEFSPLRSLVNIIESDLEFVWDDDSRQYGVNIIYLILEKCKFPIRLDKEAMFVEHISS